MPWFKSLVGDHRVMLSIVFLAGLLRVGWVYYARTVPYSDFRHYDRLALGLAEGRGYVDQAGDPTAFYPVGWPFFLSLVYRVFGHSLIAAQLVNVLMGVGVVILTYLIARYLLDRRTALIAALIVALNPTLILYSSTLGTESLFVFLLMLITWLTIRVIAGRSSADLLLIGLLTGFAILTRPVAIGVPFIAFGAYYIVNRRDLRQTSINFAIVLVISALIVTPWIARNAMAIGSPVLQSSSGLNMWIGHSPQATGGWMDAPPVPGLSAVSIPGAGPNATEKEANSVYMSAAIESLLNNPLRIVTLFPNRMFELWAGHSHAVGVSAKRSERAMPEIVLDVLPIFTQANIIILLLMSLVALGMKHARDIWIHGLGTVLSGIFVYWNVFHALIFGKGRFHVPVEPFLGIFAASALSAILYAYARRSGGLSRSGRPNYDSRKHQGGRRQ